MYMYILAICVIAWDSMTLITEPGNDIWLPNEVKVKLKGQPPISVYGYRNDYRSWNSYSS